MSVPPHAEPVEAMDNSHPLIVEPVIQSMLEQAKEPKDFPAQNAYASVVQWVTKRLIFIQCGARVRVPTYLESRHMSGSSQLSKYSLDNSSSISQTCNVNARTKCTSYNFPWLKSS